MKITETFKNLAQKEIKVLIAIFIIVFGTLLFLILAGEVSSNSTKHFDEAIIKSLRNPENYSQPIAPKWITNSMTDITSLGSGTVLVLVTLIVIGFLILKNKYDTMWLVILATMGGALIVLSLKDFFERVRPDIIFHLVSADSYSFPSGHSMMSAVVYLTQASILARIQKKKSIRFYILTVALIITFLIGISRIYLGVHYPTDVLAGWSLGLAWASFCWFIAWYLGKKRKLKKYS